MRIHHSWHVIYHRVTKPSAITGNSRQKVTKVINLDEKKGLIRPLDELIDTYEEESAHSDIMYDSELETELPEGNTADTLSEKEEISNTTSNDHERAEVKEDCEAEFWDGYAEGRYLNEDYSFRYANPPLNQSDIYTDYRLALFQSDFIESIDRGEFPGLAYKVGILWFPV
ncbi:hypothetical protein MKZ26_17715 [Sporosarcina sp. FSL K6-6792]|uniref:hypothetical protein n=1 Tax=Sporosarcina sp. FSL K6-6792 TaxID=2921559 RepID=UPI0030FA9553